MLPKNLLSLQHPFVKYLVSLRKERCFRRKEQKVLVIGTKMVKEIFSQNTKIETLLVERDFSFTTPYPVQNTYTVSKEILKKITGVPEPEPIVATISMPLFQDLSNTSHLLVLDGISDPGNLGTLLRTALALGWDGAYLLENTCDPYNEKALRAAKGATFRLPLQEGSWEQLLTILTKNSFQVLVADKEGQKACQIPKKTPIALLLSRESQGVREEAKHLFQRVTIPMQDSMESLNVASAGAILLYQLKGDL